MKKFRAPDEKINDLSASLEKTTHIFAVYYLGIEFGQKVDFLTCALKDK